MELKVFIKQFLKFWPILAILAVLGGTAGATFASFGNPQYKTSILVYFAPSQNQVLSTTANEFTDTILGILKTLGFETDGQVEIRKVAPQIIQFQIAASTKEEVETKASKLPTGLEANLGKVLGSEKVSLTPVTPQLEIRQPANLLVLNILVGVATGFVLGTTLASMIIYFRA